jgi:D-3-phosphoglycerate dehydrogenase
VNAARGAIVDEAALLDSLRNRRLAGAALDVFGEQPLRQSHPFAALDNVILTPHSAALTEEAMLRMGLQSVEEVRRALAGEASDNVVLPGVNAT